MDFTRSESIIEGDGMRKTSRSPVAIRRRERQGRVGRHIAFLVAAAAILFSPVAFGRDEAIRELVDAAQAIDPEPIAELGFELLPPSYPVRPVEQEPTNGLRHGFICSTTGGLVVRVDDFKLAGRMPIRTEDFVRNTRLPNRHPASPASWDASHS